MKIVTRCLNCILQKRCSQEYPVEKKEETIP